MVEGHLTDHWDRLLFRDYLIKHTGLDREYEALKVRLVSASPQDQVVYSRGKTVLWQGLTRRWRTDFVGR